MLTPPRWNVIQQMRQGKELWMDERNVIWLSDPTKPPTQLLTPIKRAVVRALENYTPALIVFNPSNRSWSLTPDGQTIEPVGSTPRNVPRASPISIYLGTDEVAATRIEAIDAITQQYGGRSPAFQKLADGKLKLVPSDED